MERQERVAPREGGPRSDAERIARRVAVQRELARLAEGVTGHPVDAALVLAVIGAVGAAVVLGLIYFSLR